jgi:hypothetical protein
VAVIVVLMALRNLSVVLRNLTAHARALALLAASLMLVANSVATSISQKGIRNGTINLNLVLKNASYK